MRSNRAVAGSIPVRSAVEGSSIPSPVTLPTEGMCLMPLFAPHGVSCSVHDTKSFLHSGFLLPMPGWYEPTCQLRPNSATSSDLAVAQHNLITKAMWDRVFQACVMFPCFCPKHRFRCSRGALVLSSDPVARAFPSVTPPEIRALHCACLISLTWYVTQVKPRAGVPAALMCDDLE